MSNDETFGTILVRIAEACREVYGARLVAAAVFGSVGRGTPTNDSDIDLLVIARDLPPRRTPRVREFAEVERRLASTLAAARTAGVNTRLSPVLKTPEEVRLGSPLFLDMTDDAKILHDEKGFFANQLEELRARLERLGSKRVWIGDAWYWDLKPDYKPGEIFEI